MHARTDAPTLICHMSWLVSVVEPMSHPHTPLMQQQMADTCVLVCRRSRQHPVLRHVFLCVGGADNISKDDPLHRAVSPLPHTSHPRVAGMVCMCASQGTYGPLHMCMVCVGTSTGMHEAASRTFVFVQG